MKVINLEHNTIISVFQMIDMGDINEVIEFAKKEDIFAPKINRYQKRVVQKIKNRLEKEGLSLEIVKPD